MALSEKHAGESEKHAGNTTESQPPQEQPNPEFDPGYDYDGNYYGNEDLDYYKPQQDTDAENYFGSTIVAPVGASATPKNPKAPKTH
ncbi:hypothetical protein ABVK25_010434 [Lepraria finkii]|uniref:Uncharacterized protein n=1 Tax=Lepraria finkii TaxID=1340010 RepID=A0ABR4AWN2_9LECA